MNFYNMMMEEEEEDDELAFVVEGLSLVAHVEEASSSRRRRDPNAPPRTIRERDREMGNARIEADYFGSNPVYSDDMFRRR
jgi:hypothetical protein